MVNDRKQAMFDRQELISRYDAIGELLRDENGDYHEVREQCEDLAEDLLVAANEHYLDVALENLADCDDPIEWLFDHVGAARLVHIGEMIQVRKGWKERQEQAKTRTDGDRRKLIDEAVAALNNQQYGKAISITDKLCDEQRIQE